MWINLHHAQRGRGHIKNDIPCQDKTFALKKNDCSAIALADGAGSARLSHFGAESTTQFVCNYLCDSFDNIFLNNDPEPVKTNIIEAVNNNLSVLSQSLNCDVHDLACTLLAVAIKDDRYILLHCGDGVSGYMREDTLKVGSKPYNPEEFANITVFVTSSTAAQNMQMFKGLLNGIRGFALMSDGCELCFYDKKNSKLAPIIGRIIDDMTYKPIDSVCEGVSSFFENTVIKYKTNTDDSSIALLVKRNKETSKYHLLSFEERCELFSIKLGCPNTRSALQRAEKLVYELQTPLSLSDISKKMRIKEKYMKKKLDRFVDKGCIKIENGRYVSLIVA